MQTQIDGQCTCVSENIDDGGWNEAGRRLGGGWTDKGAVRMLEGGWEEAGRQPYITKHTHTYTYMHIYVCIYRYQ